MKASRTGGIMKLAFTTALAALVLSPAGSVAQLILPARPAPLPALILPLNIPMAAAATFPLSMPLQLPGPLWPLPAMKTILPGPAMPPGPIIFASVRAASPAARPPASTALRGLRERKTAEPGTAAETAADAARSLFDGARPSETFTYPEQELERELGLP